MKQGHYWKRELYCANYKMIMIAVIVHFISGFLSLLCGGNASVYRYLVLPYFAPPPFLFGRLFIHCSASRLVSIFHHTSAVGRDGN